MICYKGFNQDLCCTLGQGTMQYKVGETYTAKAAQTARTGLHCVEEPIEVLRWYPVGRYCIVAAEGDINESDDKIACTQMRILKEKEKIRDQYKKATNPIAESTDILIAKNKITIQRMRGERL